MEIWIGSAFAKSKYFFLRDRYVIIIYRLLIHFKFELNYKKKYIILFRSSKVITFIDLAGHEKYLKTTVFGMTGHAPDFGMLMVGGFFYILMEIIQQT